MKSLKLNRIKSYEIREFMRRSKRDQQLIPALLSPEIEPRYCIHWHVQGGGRNVLTRLSVKIWRPESQLQPIRDVNITGNPNQMPNHISASTPPFFHPLDAVWTFLSAKKYFFFKFVKNTQNHQRNVICLLFCQKVLQFFKQKTELSYL